jgi:hypothetical protein
MSIAHSAPSRFVMAWGSDRSSFPTVSWVMLTECHMLWLCLQLCTALQAEIEEYKRHSSTAAGRSPGGRGIVSHAGTGASSGASAAAIAELEQQLQASQQQVAQLQRQLEDSAQEADRTMTALRAQRAEEMNALASATADLSQVCRLCLVVGSMCRRDQARGRG